MVSSTAHCSQGERARTNRQGVAEERATQADRDACSTVHTTYVHMYVVHRYNKMKRKRVWQARNSIHLGSLEDPTLAMIFVHQ